MEWISIGRVTKTHGLKGDLKFYPSINETWVTEIKQIRLSLENPLINFNNYHRNECYQILNAIDKLNRGMMEVT